jgi:crotonobetainyl-CoA:carnitine CoA-transferase CaiB-like acyl-CoA transferase
VVDAPDADAGSVLMHNIIPRLSATPGRLRRAAPTLGEHTHELLRTLGYDEARVAEMSAQGVIDGGEQG